MRRSDAIVVHSQYGRRALVDGLGVDPARVHVIHHGAFEHLTHQPREEPLPPRCGERRGPVVLFFGLLRPYKGIEVLLDAWRGVSGAELWIVGRPRMDIAPLRARAASERALGCRGSSPTRSCRRSSGRADIVVLPYARTERFDQSGVLATALAFGKRDRAERRRRVLGGRGDGRGSRSCHPVTRRRCARVLSELIADAGDGAARAAARAAGRDEYSWERRRDARSRCTSSLCGENPAGMTASRSSSGLPPVCSSTRRSATAWCSPRSRASCVAMHSGVASSAAAAAGSSTGSDVGTRAPLRRVSVIVAAYAEQEVIAARVANLRALDYPPERAAR